MNDSVTFQDNFWLPAAAICLAGFLFTFIAVFPGLMTWDSFVMYNMGVEWEFDDWHHPFIGVLMGLGHFITGDPSPYLFIQLSLLWTGIYLFSLALRNQIGNWAIIAPFIGLLPFNLSLSGYLHKTPILTACFFFSCSWLFLSYTRNKKPMFLQIAALVIIIFLGSVVRGYSYLAALPILGFMVWLILRNTNIRRPIVVAIVFPFIIIVLYLIANNFFVYNVLEAQHRASKIQAIYKFDMAAIYVLTGKVYGAKFLKSEYKDKDLAIKNYKKHNGLWRILNFYEGAINPEDERKMRKEWLLAISENFKVYLQHKKQTAFKCFGLTQKVAIFRSAGTASEKNTHNITKLDTVFYSMYKELRQLTRFYFFMQPWFWALLNCVFSLLGIILFIKNRYRHFVLPHCIMLWSASLLLFPYLLLCLSADARFTFWNNVSTSFGAFGLTSVFIAKKFEGFGKNIIRASN
jgi:hypothetical protein